MTPFYEEDNITIIHGDCMEGMKRYPDKYFELAIVDPPYGIGNWTMEARDARPYNRKWDVAWNESCPTGEYFKELFRVSEHQIIWGCNYYREFIPSGGAIIWDKGNRSGIGSGGEIASCSKFQMVAYFFYQHTGYITKEKNRIHPCQKPVKLYEWLLKNYAKEGDKILDTHGGSLSIALACHNMGYSLTAFELDKDYIEASVKRLIEHKKQQRMF